MVTAGAEIAIAFAGGDPVGRPAARRPRGQAAARLGAGAARPDRDRQRARAKRAACRAVALDTQIAAYILNAALRSQTLASIASERLEIELPPDGALGGAEHAAAAGGGGRRGARADRRVT